jgi:peptidyl-prolyl cis-trans isomerase C
MNMSLRTGVVMAVATTLLTLAGCDSANTPKAVPSANTAVAATVNGSPINASLVDLVVKQQAEHGRPGGLELRSGVIDQLAMQLILAQEAVKLGLDKTPEVVDQTELAQKAILARAFVQNYTKNNPVSDDMVKAEYEKVKSRITGNEYKARHILVESDSEAKDIIAKLKRNPQAFETLAKERSKDSATKGTGGELGWFDPHAMAPAFGDAVSKLSKGQFTNEPVKSAVGYHVILLEDVREKQFPAFEQVKPSLQQQVAQENLKKLFANLKGQAKVEISSAPVPTTPPTGQSGPAETGNK